MNKPSISIVIPALNEEGNIESSIDTVEEALDGYFSSYEIIVVDDGSSDRTAEIVERRAQANPSVKLLRHAENKGMGTSLLDGFNQASKEYIGSFPGDNGLDGKSLQEMFKLVGQADVVVYYIANPEFRSWTRRFLSWGYVTLLNLVFNLRLRYYNGHAIYRAPLVKNMTGATVGHGFLSQVLIRLVKAGCSYVEIGTLQHERKTGKTKAFSMRNLTTVLGSVARLAWEMNGKGAQTRRREKA